MATDEAGELAAALPGYEIGGELGRGAFGVVLAGRHRQLGRRVAIKQLPRSYSAHPEVRHRFSAEAKILASLDHPHIVPIFDYVEHGGLCVLVMELLPGGTVRQRQGQGLGPKAACAIALAACAALDYAHQRGVLHRDVKPDNLLFTSGGLLKVTDFGIARVVGDVAVTQVGEMLGTPLYMAPEQCLNQPLGPATDVYATGLMLYELLAGHHPFAGGGDSVTAMYRQVHEDARPLNEANPDVPEVISTVVMRAMAKNPALRFHSARAFGGALAEAAAEAWGAAWPAGDAVRIMSVGPIDAATGWPLTTGPVNIADRPWERDLGVTNRVPDPGRPAVPPLRPTVIRANPAPAVPPPPWIPATDGPAMSPAWSAATDGPAASPAWGPAVASESAPWPPGPPRWSTPEPPGSSGGYWPSGAVDAYAPPAQPSGSWPPERHDPVGYPPTEVNPYPPAAEPARSGRRWPIVVLVLVLVVAVGAGAALFLPTKSAPRSTADTTVPTDPASVAADLSKLIQQSAAARTEVVTAVASIENCSANLSDAVYALAAGATTRQEVVASLQGLQVSALPNGPAMRDALTTALDDSVDADHHYQDWLSEVEIAGCTGHAAEDANFTAGEASSAAASGAKQRFAALWDPVAATYGLPKVTSATI